MKTKFTLILINFYQNMRTNIYYLIIISIVSASCAPQYWVKSGNNIYSSNKGNIGIGTSNPDTKLTVVDTSTVISPELKWGISSTIHYPTRASAVYGHTTNRKGVENYGGYFVSEGIGAGVFGISNDSINEGDGGVFHTYGKGGRGVIGLATNKSDQTNYGGWFDARSPNGVGIRSQGGKDGYAALLLGKTKTQSLEIYGGADLSEKFKIRKYLEIIPEKGMIVCIDQSNCGDLVISSKAYDKNIAGIISGAGDLKPGLILNQDNKSYDLGFPVALTGRVYCLVDASYGAVNPGDLLTTSDTPGYAMKVKDYFKAQGAILGKSMSSLDEGLGLVLVLVTLQ
jgi:hypothetical protein